MKKTGIILIAAALVGLVASGAGNGKSKSNKPAKKSDNPIVMTIAGEDIPFSEFDYLYRKNLNQQLEPQTLDEYINMFVDFKLKVADARAAGLDTLAKFKEEYNGIKRDFTRPYLESKEAEDSLVNEIYSHYDDELSVSHIMTSAGRTPDETEASMQKLDSIRNEIVSGRLSFENAAKEYSVDQYSSNNGGLMGTLGPNMTPWSFEDAAFNLKVGEISPVVRTDFGLHLIRVNSRKPTDGEVLVRHILKLTRGMDEAGVEAMKFSIDSIYELLKEGADFDALARKESQDPGSAKNGGKLEWFGHGNMVAAFDSVSYALKPGELSQPFATPYGFHIVEKLDTRKCPPLEEVRDKFVARFQEDNRANIMRQKKIDEFAKKYNARYFADNVNRLIPATDIEHGLESFVSMPVYEINGKTVLFGDITDDSHRNFIISLPKAYRHKDVVATVRGAYDKAILALAENDLPAMYPEYANTLKEHRDGILLFDISNEKVWERASKDTLGLEEYFRANRENYKWEKPKYKGFVLFAPNDSLLHEAKSYAEQQLAVTKPSQLAAKVQKEFSNKVRLERVIASKGDNVIMDYLEFGGPKPPATASRWEVYTSFGGKILDAPEEAADVRGAVTVDYQNHIEKEWIKELHEKYPVKVDVKKIKKLESAKK